MSKLELERWKSVGEADPVGKYEVRVIRERSTKGRERYRVKCVRAKLRAAHPDWAWKVFAQDTEDKTMKQLAYEHAFKINEFLIHGDPDNITPHEMESLKNLFAKMKGHNVARKNDPNWASVTVDDLDPLIDTGIKSQRVLKEHISCSWTAGIENLEMKALVFQFTGWLKSESEKLIAPSFSELLQKCLDDKTSSTGGVTGNPLSPAQKSRWERHLGLVEGQLLFKQGTWDQIRQDAGLFRNSDRKSLWPYDASRNSFTSYANHYVEWKEKAARDYWMDRCGHDYATFKKHYKVQVTQEECHAYFNILPPMKKTPPVKGQSDRANPCNILHGHKDRS